MGVIYKITNTVNGCAYVGKSMVSAKTRWDHHRGSAARGANTYLCKAMRKYGVENFTMEIIDQALLQEELNLKEMEWIAKLRTNEQGVGYNSTTGGDGGRHCEIAKTRQRGVRHHTEEAKRKMSETRKAIGCTPAQRESARLRGIRRIGTKMPPESLIRSAAGIKASWTPERRAAFGLQSKEWHRLNEYKGRPHSEDTKAKMRGRLVSDETREKLREKAILPNPEKSLKLSEAMRARAAAMTPEERQERSRRAALKSAEKTRGVARPIEVRMKISVANTGRVIPREQVEKQAAKLRGRKQSPEAIAARSAGAKKAYAEDPEKRQRLAERASKLHLTRGPYRKLTAEEKIIRGINSRAYWSSPAADEAKKRNAERVHLMDHAANAAKAKATRESKSEFAKLVIRRRLAMAARKREAKKKLERLEA